MITAGMSKFSALSAGDQKLNQLVAGMPKAMQIFFGGGGFDLTKAIGYCGVIYSYLLLMAAIYAVSLGAGTIAKEERDRTTEFLMVKPLSRRRVIFEKSLAVLVNTIIYNLCNLFVTIGVLNVLDKGEDVTGRITVLMLGMFLVQLIFISLGSALAGVYKDAKRTGSIAMSVLLGTYFISIAMGLTDRLNFLRVLTPFAYFDTANTLNGGSLSGGYVALSIILFALLTSVTFISYQKRDLKI
jgi:ABC-2 type transport system permease protein